MWPSLVKAPALYPGLAPDKRKNVGSNPTTPTNSKEPNVNILAAIFLMFLIIFSFSAGVGLLALITDFSESRNVVVHGLGKLLSKAAPWSVVVASLSLVIVVLLGFVLAIVVLA